jgi:hypothetical protein
VAVTRLTHLPDQRPGGTNQPGRFILEDDMGVVHLWNWYVAAITVDSVIYLAFIHRKAMRAARNNESYYPFVPMMVFVTILMVSLILMTAIVPMLSSKP